jgi:hypothetical protein
MPPQMQLPERIASQPELTAGVYHSQASLDSERLILPTEASRQRVEAHLPPAETAAAIGMAALPESARHNQLSNLVYQGLTSEQYAERHNAFIARWTAQVQARQLEEHLEAERRRRDEDDEAKAKNKKKSGTKTLVGASK